VSPAFFRIARRFGMICAVGDLPPKLLLSLAFCSLGSACETPQAHGAQPAQERSQVSALETAPPSAQHAVAPSAPAAPARPPSPALPVPHFLGSDYDDDRVLDQLGHAEPLSFKPVGSTSTVFHVRFKSAVEAAFKATTGNRPHGPASEVAAYRLGRCLGLDSVPPAVSREIPAAQIHALLDPKYEARWPEIRERMGVAEDGMVRGAAIYWIPVLADLGVDRQRGLRLLHEWLRTGGELKDEKRSLAASLSTMLGFDYLIGNFDRWSGDNVLGNPQAGVVYIRDHDQAFPLGLGEHLHRRMLHDLLLAERFSRRFHASVQRLERRCLERELARDPEGRQGRLLNERQVADLMDRRQTLLSHIDALISEHGEHEVLVFE
jgi:hypothetical protein